MCGEGGLQDMCYKSFSPPRFVSHFTPEAFILLIQLFSDSMLVHVCLVNVRSSYTPKQLIQV